MLEHCNQPRPNPNQIAYSQANEAPGDGRVPQVNSQPSVTNDIPSDRTVLPINSQQLPVAAGSQQKREREEDCNDLSGERDSTKKIRKANGKSVTQPSEGTNQIQPHSTKGSKRKATGAKLKTKVEGEQAMTRLEEDGRWSDEDTKLLLETLLGGDSEFYEGLAGNAKHVYKKVMET